MVICQDVEQMRGLHWVIFLKSEVSNNFGGRIPFWLISEAENGFLKDGRDVNY